MPQNEYMELHKKRHGVRLDTEERSRKRVAREGHKASEFAQKVWQLLFLSFSQTYLRCISLFSLSKITLFYHSQ